MTVKVRLADPVAGAEATDTVTFTGVEFVYPPEFYEAGQRCLDALKNPDEPPSHLIVLPWDLWSRLGAHQAERVRSRIVVLEQLDASGHQEHFSAALQQLAGDVGVGVEAMTVRHLTEASRLSDVRLHDEPPPIKTP